MYSSRVGGQPSIKHPWEKLSCKIPGGKIKTISITMQLDQSMKMLENPRDKNI
jgi:hypothetical protein